MGSLEDCIIHFWAVNLAEKVAHASWTELLICLAIMSIVEKEQEGLLLDVRLAFKMAFLKSQKTGFFFS